MAKVLTVKFLEHVQRLPKRQEIGDGLLTGLYFVVQPTGAKSWALRYRFKGRPHKLTLGRYPAIDLVTARKLGTAALRLAAEGKNPAEDKKSCPGAEQIGNLEISVAVGQFINVYAKNNVRSSTCREYKRQLESNAVARWAGRSINEISKRDVLQMLDEIVERGSPIAANRNLAVLKNFFNWCVSRELISASPVLGIRRPISEATRERVLSDTELSLIWQAANAEGWPFGTLVQLLILTGQRRDEVAGMSRNEVVGNLWRLPGTRTKNGMANDIHLSNIALSLIYNAPTVKAANSSPLLFSTNGITQISGFSKARARISVRARQIAESNQQDQSLQLSLATWTYHDLRRTCATGMARLGIGLPVIEKILNHKSGTFGGVVGIYQRYSFTTEKRDALECWSEYVTKAAEIGTAEVVAHDG